MQPARGYGTQLGFYFLVTLAGTWAFQLPVLLAQWKILPGTVGYYFLPAFLGGFAPLAAAFWAAHREGGREAVAELKRSLWRPQLGLHWYIIALSLFGGIYVLGVSGYRVLGGGGAVSWLYLPESAAHVIAMIIVPLTEEPGWRGYALPRLQARHGALRASLILGAAWAAWHLMMFLIPGPSPRGFAIAILNIMAGSLVFTWLYNRTQRSLLVAILAHAGAHLNNPGRAANGEETPMLIYTLAIIVVGGALVVFDRAAWPERGCSSG
jgi:membrane protease YdiL (CAAX protease family)